MTLRRYALLLCLLPGFAAAVEVPRHALPTVQVQKATDSAKEDPLRYAAALATNLNTPDGAWDQPAPGIARWRMGIDSEGAISLALRLEDLHLPAGAELRWIGDDSGDVQGPFSADISGRLWLPLVRGARATLEVRLPATLKEQFGLRVAEAQHGFLGLGEANTAKGQFGTSGSCNVDVSCSAANNWLSQVRSVVLLTVGNSAVCTGTLVNNQRQDSTPFVLTANHCDFDDVTISSVRAYFNVNRGSCGTGANGRVDQNIRAAEVVALNESSDFALLRLLPSDNGRVATDFNVFFAGWNVSTSAVPSSGVAIHHPRGDDKKISQYNGATKQNNVQIGTGSNSFRVDAWEVVWNSGTTQQGSSGAALFDQDGRVIGVLSGGTAACNASGTGPNNSPDYFGRLELAWTGTDKAIGSTLKAALDPDDTGITALSGLNRGSNPPPVIDPPPVTNPPASSGGGGGALPALLLAALTALGLLRRRRT